MMKTKRIIYVFSLLLMIAGLMTSCVKDDDFDLPDTSINPPDIDGDIITITDVKNMLVQEAGASNLNALSENAQYTFQSTNLYMEAYVISSDESGNFYQEMVLQDKPENPTAGIKIMLTDNPLFTTYEIGRKVYVQLDGFTVGFSNGVIALGIPTDGSDFLSKAPQAFTQKIMRSEVKDTIVPLEMNIADFDRAHDNLWIRLNDMEFPANMVLGDSPKSFAADSGDQYDAERQMESCDGATTKLLTSTFSDFKALKLPKKMGYVDGVLSKTYNGAQYVMKINYPSDFQFNEDRCDGEDPGNPSNPGEPGQAGYPFFEGFESLADYDPIDNLSGWTNQDVTGSGRTWEARSFDSNHYAQLTAFGASGDVETWMVTPGVDLSSANTPVLTFDTEDGYYNGDALSIYVSTDFGGDASTATWDEVTNQATINSGHTNGYGTFIPSGEVDLSSYAGQTVYVGFKYSGNDTGTSTTYQVDNVSIDEAGSNPGNPTDPGDGDNPDDPSANATLAFAGADFENWSDFTGGLNSFGLQSYATEGVGTGQNGSNSFEINTDPTTTDGNDYVFTALATSDLPSSYDKIDFYMKGSADKSVSINIYKADGSYYVYNLDNVTSSKTLTSTDTNQYANGTIDTGGEWVLIELDLSGITDINTTDTSGDFFALKIGKNANYDLQFDNFTIE